MTPAILVVDDDQNRVRAVTSVVAAVLGDTSSVDYCSDVATAVRRMAAKRFDVVVIDVVLPLRIDAPPVPEGGIVLLREILRGSVVRMPTYIIGLTSYEDAFAKASAEFVSNALTLLRFSASETTWEDALRSRLKHVMMAALQTVPVPAFASDVAILCALDSPELQAVRRLKWDWNEYAVTGDHTIYYEGRFVNGGSDRRVIATAAPRMGMPTAAVMATKLIYSFRPRLLVNCGIAAGMPDKTAFGDVIIADPSWDHGSGKWKRDGKELRFYPSPYQIPLSPAVRELFKKLAASAELLDDVKAAWPADAPATPIKLRVAPMASGAAVIADKEVREQVENQHRKVTGVEMEAYSLFEAAQECSEPRPAAAAVKAVVDYADGGKNDQHQRYAAYVAAEVVRLFCERFASFA